MISMYLCNNIGTYIIPIENADTHSIVLLIVSKIVTESNNMCYITNEKLGNM